MNVRFLRFCAAAASAFLLFAFVQGDLAVPNWVIGANHCLVWDGEPYAPVGLRCPVDLPTIQAALTAGVRDFMVEVPANGAGLADATGVLETAHARYMLCVNSMGPASLGYAIQPDGNRLMGITEPRHVEITIPGAVSVLAVVATEADAQVESAVRIQTPNGRFVYDVRPRNDLEHVLLLYPEMSDLRTPDFWEGFDRHRDKLLAALRSGGIGKGLRGIVNPLGELLRIPVGPPQVIPESKLFRMEFEAQIQAKYHSVETAERSWSMSMNDIKTFEGMAKLVPLWRGNRGVSCLWDTETDKLYPVDRNQCQFWNDVTAATDVAAHRRCADLCAALRAVENVPVFQDFIGWNGAYETQTRVFDGVSCKAEGPEPSSLTEDAAPALSVVARWPNPGCNVVSDLKLGIDKPAPSDLKGAIDTLAALGERGFFLRATTTDELAWIAQLARTGEGDSWAGAFPTPVFYPESAANPAYPQPLPGNRVWLPSPEPGMRLNLGTSLTGYRMSGSMSAVLVAWATDKPVRTVFRVPKEQISRTRFEDTSGADPKCKKVANGIEANIGTAPVVVTGCTDLPIPTIAFDEIGSKMDFVEKLAERAHMDVTQATFDMSGAAQAWDKNPVAAYFQLDTAFMRLLVRLSPYTWMEAEAARSNDFGDRPFVPGASGDYVLRLDSDLEIPGQVYAATYEMPNRYDGDQDVWVAMRIPEPLIPSFTVRVADQVMHVSGRPVSRYGLGFAWYYLGTTRLQGPTQRIKIEVDGSHGAFLDFDALVLSPSAFKPNGAFAPDWTPAPSPKRKGRY